MQGKLFQMCSRIFFTAVYCLWVVNYQNVMLLSSSCLQIPPRENCFQYVRRVYATAINFPCIITLIASFYFTFPDRTQIDYQVQLVASVKWTNYRRRSHLPLISRLYNVCYSRCAPMYGKCRLLRYTSYDVTD